MFQQKWIPLIKQALRISFATAAQLTGKAASGVNSDITSLTGITGPITVGGKKYTRSATQPSSPSVGDTWDELDGTGNTIEQWEWSGIYWLTRQFYKSIFPDDTTYSSSGSLVTKAIPFDGSKNIFIRSVNANFLVNTTNNATNYWTIDFQYRRRSGAYVSLTTRNTSSLSAATGSLVSVPVNTHLVLADTESNNILRSAIFLTTTGTPGTFQLVGGDFIYQWARK